MRIFILLSSFVFISLTIKAQVSGTVTSATTGDVIPGVRVVVRGYEEIYTITDSNGFFKLNIPKEGEVLIFSYLGMVDKNVEILNRKIINVQLENEDVGIEDVVVTALGISRDERSVGYAVQSTSFDDVVVKDPLSVSNSLQGRIAGLQIRSGAGTVGGTSSVFIRGVSSLSGNNQPLFVVDGVILSNYNFSNDTEGYDFGNGAQDINPNDVDEVFVLKGAAATTLYGDRGANGVIVIMTKSGKNKKGVGVEFKSTITFDNVYILPNFQDEYGGGRSLDFSTFVYNPTIHGDEWEAFDGIPYVNTGTDESWGPKLDGTEVLHWDSFVPESDTYNKTRPWVANPDNYKDLFNTGITLSNSIAVDGGSNTSTFRLGFTNINQTGVVPNSELKKNIVSFKGSNKLNEFVEVFTSINYIKQSTNGRSRFGYSGDGESIAGAMRIWTQRQVDTKRLENLYYSEILGNQVGWNLKDISDGSTYIRWSNNPFWTLNNIYASDTKDRLYGNVGFEIKIADGLKFTSTAKTDYYTLNYNKRVGSGGTTTPSYSESTISSFENNFEGILDYSKKISNWSLNTILGGNIRYSQYKSSSISTVDGLIVDNFFNVSNSVSPVDIYSYFSERQTNSLFAFASLGYKDYLYLDISGRNDWSSTLPVENNENSYFYPAVSGSFIFSEFLRNNKMLSYGKFRAGYAFVGNDTDPYKLYDVYNIDQFGTATTFTVSDVRNNPSLKNETSAEFELGLELLFFNGLFSTDLTYFNRKTYDQIIGLDISSTSGYSKAYINAGEVQNSGVEFVSQLNLIKNEKFLWSVLFNYSSYNNTINSLYEGLEQYEISNVGSAWVTADVGGEFGVMYVYGGYEKDADGNKLIDANGYFIRKTEPVKVGNIFPDFNGGVLNTFKVKNVSIGILIDFQKGGVVYSYANKYATGAGQTIQTVGYNDKGNPIRDAVEDGGGIRSDGVFAEGTIIDGVDVSGQANNIYIDARSYFRYLRNFPEEYVYDASYIKIRELKIGYSLPSSIIKKTVFNTVTFNLVARNLALLMSNTDGFDPEQVNSISMSSIGYEGGSLPSTRSIGFNINVKF